MTYATCAPHDSILYDLGRSPWKAPAIVLGAAALTCCALAGAWLSLPRLVIPNFVQAPALRPESGIFPEPLMASLRPAFWSEPAPVPLAQSASPGLNVEPTPPALRPAVAGPDNVQPILMPGIHQSAGSIPAAPPRFSKIHLSVRHGLSPGSQSGTMQTNATVLPNKSTDIPTFLEKLFGMREPTGPALVYAAPEDRTLGDTQSISSGRYDKWTAVYDIASHTVYLPDGARLEAHSGLGGMLDAPRYVSQRDRGATPPHV